MNFCALSIDATGRPPGAIRSVGIARFRDRYLAGAQILEACTRRPGASDSTAGARTAIAATAPWLPALAAALGTDVAPRVVVYHSARVHAAIQGAAQRQGVTLPAVTWLDSESLARLAWPSFEGRCSHLLSIARRLRIECAREGVVDHAVATGRILTRIAEKLGTDLSRLAAASSPSA